MADVGRECPELDLTWIDKQSTVSVYSRAISFGISLVALSKNFVAYSGLQLVLA